MTVKFFTEEIDFQLSYKNKILLWVQRIATLHKKDIKSLNYIFCSDKYLLKINQRYLDHDYYTDIITFDQSDTFESIAGDIFISIDRVRNNAKTMNTAFNEELKRVIIHGLLHLLGYDDGTEIEIKQMREKEEACLSLFET